MTTTAAVKDLFSYKNHIFNNLSPEKHRRYFSIAGITVCLESELDLAAMTFKEELATFSVKEPGDDTFILRHHFEMPDLKGFDLGKELYRRPPWAISIKDEIWCYKGILKNHEDDILHRLALFNSDFTKGVIYTPSLITERVYKYGWDSLSLMPSDQIWLGSILADRSAILLHSAAVIINGYGLVFVGHSGAGKSTIIKMVMRSQPKQGLNGEVLCDDRNIIRRWPDGWHVHGTWCHGEIASVSSTSAPLRAIIFLEQAEENKITAIADRKLVWRKLLGTIVRPMVTEKWWQQVLDTLEMIVDEVPCYNMNFDKSGVILKELEQLIR